MTETCAFDHRLRLLRLQPYVEFQALNIGVQLLRSLVNLRVGIPLLEVRVRCE
jgi:hypothetical protein